MVCFSFTEIHGSQAAFLPGYGTDYKVSHTTAIEVIDITMSVAGTGAKGEE